MHQIWQKLTASEQPAGMGTPGIVDIVLLFDIDAGSRDE
ncbi:hypothetical protein A2U01_0060881, partial [Trifolium medium]|nr:hypothetical protein [Trifolium medium]